MNARTKISIAATWCGAIAVVLAAAIDRDSGGWLLLLGGVFLTAAAVLSITSAMRCQARQTRRAVYGAGRRWDDAPERDGDPAPQNVRRLYSSN